MLNQKYYASKDIMAFFNKDLGWNHEEIKGNSTLREVNHKLLKDLISC